MAHVHEMMTAAVAATATAHATRKARTMIPALAVMQIPASAGAIVTPRANYLIA